MSIPRMALLAVAIEAATVLVSQLLFVASNLGRTVAGSLGGWLAGRSSSPTQAVS